MANLEDELKRILLAGLGAVAVTAEKAKEMIEDLVKKGELTVEQGKVLNQELRHNIKKTVKENVNVSVRTSSPEELDELLDKMTPEQIEQLKERIYEREAAVSEEETKEVEEVVEQTEAYILSQDTWFVLENLDTLRKNGRLGTVKALVATALKIKPVMGSTDEGTIIQLDQARGMKKALVKMVNSIEEKKSSDPQERMVGIAHCNCPQRAEMVKEEIIKRLPFKDVILVNTAGVSTMYANDGGIIVVA